MRALRLIFTAVIAIVTLIAGLFTAAVIAVLGLVFFLSKRFFDRPTPSQTVQSNRPLPQRMNDTDVIDITASEVPVESSKR